MRPNLAFEQAAFQQRAGSKTGVIATGRHSDSFAVLPSAHWDCMVAPASIAYILSRCVCQQRAIRLLLADFTFLQICRLCEYAVAIALLCPSSC